MIQEPTATRSRSDRDAAVAPASWDARQSAAIVTVDAVIADGASTRGRGEPAAVEPAAWDGLSGAGGAVSGSGPRFTTGPGMVTDGGAAADRAGEGERAEATPWPRSACRRRR